MIDHSTSTAIHLVITVVDRGRSDKVISVCDEAGVPLHMVSLGHGTARTEMLDLLGLGETSKDIVLSLTPQSNLYALLELLADRMNMRYPGKGISFAIPLNSVSARMYRALTETENPDTERMSTDMACPGKYELVVALTNRGYTDLIMDAARQVGAHGGTVLNTRGLGSEEVEQVLGISIQAEKELVFLVVPSEKRQDVMQAISHEAGLKTPAKGIVLSLPVSHAIGLA